MLTGRRVREDVNRLTGTRSRPRKIRVSECFDLLSTHCTRRVTHDRCGEGVTAFCKGRPTLACTGRPWLATALAFNEDSRNPLCPKRNTVKCLIAVRISRKSYDLVKNRDPREHGCMDNGLAGVPALTSNGNCGAARFLVSTRETFYFALAVMFPRSTTKEAAGSSTRFFEPSIEFFRTPVDSATFLSGSQ